jgi:hypothetical protein
MKTLEGQLGDYGQLQEEMFGPIRLDEITSKPLAAERARGSYWVFTRHPAALAMVAMVAVLIFIGGIILLTERTGDSEPVDQPTTTEQVTGPEVFTWEYLAPETFRRPGYQVPVQRIVSNGNGFLANNYEGWTWTSADGVTWSEGPSDFYALPGVVGESFLAQDAEHIDGTYWRSDDGVNWIELAPESGQLPELRTFSWFGLTVDEIAGLSHPETDPSDDPAGAVFKVGDRFVTYYWNPQHILEGAVSDDGQVWERFEVAPFLTEWLDSESPRTMPDRDVSWRLWSGTFAVGHERVLALTADSEVHRLWESTDGVVWEEIPTTSPERLLSANTNLVSSYVGDGPAPLSTRHITALPSGWILAPWDPPFSAPGSLTYYSIDGRTWESLLPPDLEPDTPLLIRVADGKIFFFIYDFEPGTFRGVHVGTLGD